MKTIEIKANEIMNWNDKGIDAYHNHSHRFVKETKVKEGKTLRICLADSYDFNNFTDSGLPNQPDSLEIVQRANKRSLMLFVAGIPFGWATFHNEHETEEETQEETTENNEQ